MYICHNQTKKTYWIHMCHISGLCLNVILGNLHSQLTLNFSSTAVRFLDVMDCFYVLRLTHLNISSQLFSIHQFPDNSLWVCNSVSPMSFWFANISWLNALKLISVYITWTPSWHYCWTPAVLSWSPEFFAQRVRIRVLVGEGLCQACFSEWQQVNKFYDQSQHWWVYLAQNPAQNPL